MFYPLESFIAKRYIGSKRKEIFISIITIISILSVAISVMVLNIVMSIMTGFKNELRTKLLDTSAHIVVRSNDGLISNWEGAVNKIKSFDNVKEAAPYTFHQVMLSANGVTKGLLIRGISNDEQSVEKLAKLVNNVTKNVSKSDASTTLLEDKTNYSSSKQSLSSVKFLLEPSPTKVLRPDGTYDEVKLPPLVISKDLSQITGLVPGSIVNLLSPQLSASPQGLIPKFKRFKVVGIYSSGIYELDTGLVYTSISAAQEFFGLRDRVTAIDVSLANIFEAEQISKKIEDTLNSSLTKEESYNKFSAADWGKTNKAFWDAIKLEEQVYFIVLLLLILIASFSIASTLVMVVIEKTKDIAILKTLGANDRSIARVFLLQGAFIALLGVIFGTIFGYVGCILLREIGFPLNQQVFSLDKVPVHMSFSNFVLVAVSAFLISSLAGIYPARRASKLKPADALRFE